mmetsp:Transcript_98686/g.263872  ORF Transcript_98686/g.263872 Transcript_98686/m.263872 type:complete len:268 (+) Transcript_98686:521-1324(+)
MRLGRVQGHCVRKRNGCRPHEWINYTAPPAADYGSVVPIRCHPRLLRCNIKRSVPLNFQNGGEWKVNALVKIHLLDCVPERILLRNHRNTKLVNVHNRLHKTRESARQKCENAVHTNWIRLSKLVPLECHRQIERSTVQFRRTRTRHNRTDPGLLNTLQFCDARWCNIGLRHTSSTCFPHPVEAALCLFCSWKPQGQNQPLPELREKLKHDKLILIIRVHINRDQGRHGKRLLADFWWTAEAGARHSAAQSDEMFAQAHGVALPTRP